MTSPTSNSGGTCPPVHPVIDAHELAAVIMTFTVVILTIWLVIVLFLTLTIFSLSITYELNRSLVLDGT